MRADAEGRLHVTLCNLNPNAPVEVACEIQGLKAQKVSGRVLTASEITAHNTFEQPGVVKPAEFGGGKVTEKGFTAVLPAKSVVAMELE